MRLLFSLLFCLNYSIFYSQFLLPNEELVFSFSTKNGKIMNLVKDKNNRYIQYRFGSKNKIELQFPKERTKESWKKFHYISYWRGGGKENAGMEIDNLEFTNNGYQYLIYRAYFAEDEKHSAGVIITDKKRKESRINANPKTIKGCICDQDYINKFSAKESELFF